MRGRGERWDRITNLRWRGAVNYGREDGNWGRVVTREKAVVSASLILLGL